MNIYVNLDDDIFIRVLLIVDKFLKEYEKPNRRSPCDVIVGVITIK